MKKFGDFLKRSKISIDLDDSLDYKRVTIKIKHGGVSLRDIEIGKKIGTKKQFILKKGQFVLSKIDARYGAFGIAPAEVDNAIITGNFWAYDVDLSMIDIDWFNQYTNSKDFYDVCERASSGITHRKYLSEIQFLNNEVNLPSLQDQKKAVKKINNLKAFGNNLSKEINYQLNLIKDLRQAFLREAMQGKLVSNKTSDGKTGVDLLAEIQAEKAQLIKEKKIKKSKPLPPISEDEIPFDIPENWTWCRLENITSKVGSGSTPKGGDYSEKGYPFFRSQNIKNNELVYNDIKFININTHKKMNGTIVFANDLLLNITGGSLGRCALVPMNFEEGNVSQHVCIIRGITLNSQFFHYLVLSPYFQGKIFQSTTGAGREGLPKYNLEQFCVPLPPIEIQEHIVAKLDGLMQYCDNLENSIKESQQYNEMLLQQVLREALEGKEESKPQLKINKTCDNNDTAILASYIIQELNTPDFGRTKLQKILHLAEYHCKLETPLQYYKKTAGPYSKNLENDIENLLRRNKLYDSKKEELKNSDKSKVNYIPLSGAKQINSFFTTEFKDQKRNIDNLLDKFNDKSMEFCEMISTMYAVWNNRLIKGETIDNEELKKDFIAWDPQKIKFLDKLDYSIEWIKKEGLEPTGFGKYIDKQ